MRSIRSRIMIIMMFSIVLTAIVSSVLLTRFSYDAFRNESLDKMTNMVSRYAAGFDYNLQKVKDIAINVENMVLSLMNLSDLKNDSSYLDELELKLAPVIEGYANQGIRTKSAYVFFNPELDGKAHDVWYADLDGNGVIRQDEFDISFYDEFNETEDWYFVPKETLQPFWTNPYAGNADYDAHIIYISYTRPILIEGEFIGVTGSDYHFNIMKDDINAISIYDTGYAILLDENFDILVHPTLEINSNLADIQNGEYDYINDIMLEKDEGYFEYTWVDGNDKILVFKRLSNGWTFGMTVEEKEVFKWLYQTIGIMIATSVIIILFIGLLAYKLTGYLTDSLTHLGKQVKTIGEGNYDHPISKDILHKKDETGELANNIEVMRLRQKESFEALQKYNENLENEIENRTKSLKESNEKLEVSLYDNEEKNRILHEMNQQLNDVIKDMETTKRQLIESEKLASISMLATRLAHEFNTPVGNMTTLVTFIKSITNNTDQQLVNNNLKKQDLKDYLGKVDESLNLTFDNIQTIQMLVAKFKELDPSSHVTIKSKLKCVIFFIW